MPLSMSNQFATERLAADRRSQFLAESEHARSIRLAQGDRERGTAARVIVANAPGRRTEMHGGPWHDSGFVRALQGLTGWLRASARSQAAGQTYYG